MGQKQSSLSQNDRQLKRMGSFHLSTHANRRREAFKAAKKSHFSFGDVPNRSSLHSSNKQSQNNDPRRHDSNKLSTVSINPSSTSPASTNRHYAMSTKSISTPEREYYHNFGSIGNIKQSLPIQHSLNMDKSNYTHPSEASPMSNSFYENSVLYQNPPRMIEDSYDNASSTYVNIKDLSHFHTHLDDNLRKSPKIVPNTNQNNVFLESINETTATTSSLSSANSQYKRTNSHHQPITSAQLSNENLVAALLPPSPMSHKEKQRSNTNLYPQKLLSPYNLSPRSLSPSSQHMNKSDHSIDGSIHSNNSVGSGNKMAPNARYITNNIPTKIQVQPSIDFNNPPDEFSASVSSSVHQIRAHHKLSAPMVTTTTTTMETSACGQYPGKHKPNTSGINEAFSLFGLCGGDLLSINSKSDNSLSSFSFYNTQHKTPSIGLSPTVAVKGPPSLPYFPDDNKPHYQDHLGHPVTQYQKQDKSGVRNSHASLSSKESDKSGSQEEIQTRNSVAGYPDTKREDKKWSVSKRELKERSDSSHHMSQPKSSSSHYHTSHQSGRPPLTRGQSLLSQVVSPHPIPRELDRNQSPEFQGHQLLSWLCHWCGPHLKSTHKSDLYLIGCQICTCLLACKQLVPTGQLLLNDSHLNTALPINNNNMTEGDRQTLFQPESMYKWSAGSNPLITTTNISPIIFNRDREEDDDELTDGRLSRQQHKGCIRCMKLKEELYEKDLHHSYETQKLKQEQELEVFKVKNEGVMKVCQLNDKLDQLERQVEKYRILAGIEGLARQMWHEEAVAANSNLVISKSPTLQSIPSNHNNMKSNNKINGNVTTKSCSTDTYDLDPESLTSQTSYKNSSIRSPVFSIAQQKQLQSTNIFVEQLDSDNGVHQQSQNINKKQENLEKRPGYPSPNDDSDTQNQNTTHRFDSPASSVANRIKFQRGGIINTSSQSTTIEEDSNENKEGSEIEIDFEALLENGSISIEIIKQWLEINIPIDQIDLDILGAILEKVQTMSYSQTHSKSGIILSPSNSSNKKSVTMTTSSQTDRFWNDLLSVVHLEEKIDFIRHYKVHQLCFDQLQISFNEFNYVAHYLQHSESLLQLLLIILEIDNADINSRPDVNDQRKFLEMSISLDKLIQLKQKHLSNKTTNHFLKKVIDRYIEVQTTSRTNQMTIGLGEASSTNFNFHLFPLPEPSDLYQLLAPEMSLTSLQNQLTKLQENIGQLNQISRCILSCSRHSLVSSEINLYSTTIIQIIQQAETDYSFLHEQLEQCSHQYSILQQFFSTSMDTTLFFSVWYEFSKEFKDIWIRKVSNTNRHQGYNTSIANSKPIGAVLPRLIKDN